VVDIVGGDNTTNVVLPPMRIRVPNEVLVRYGERAGAIIHKRALDGATRGLKDIMDHYAAETAAAGDGEPKSPSVAGDELERAVKKAWVTAEFTESFYHPSFVWVPGEPVTWGMGKRSPAAGKRQLKVWKDTIQKEWRKRHCGPVIADSVQLFMRFMVLKARKDLTNLLKAAEDALNTIAFEDDARVYRTVVEKEPCEHRDDQGVYIAVTPYHGPTFEDHR
jgi:Holliday junction resolvase RusA-like endonuclease